MTNPPDLTDGDDENEEDERWIVRLTEYARADAWQNGLLEAAGKLARFPKSHGTVPELALFQETIRQFWYTKVGGPGGEARHGACSLRCDQTNRMGLSFKCFMCVTGHRDR